MIKKCLVNTCNTTKEGDGVTLHEFPTETKQQQAWFRAILNATDQSVFKEDDVICSLHFADEFFIFDNNIKTLRSNALPFTEVRHYNKTINCTTPPRNTFQIEKRRKILSSRETRGLINLLKHHIDDLKINKRNANVLLLMQNKLREKEGVDLDIKEIRCRINNLTKKYRSERKLVGAASQWEYYKLMDDIIGKFSAGELTVEESNSRLISSTDPMPSTSTDPIPSTSTYTSSPSSDNSPIKERSPSPAASISSHNETQKSLLQFQNAALELMKKEAENFGRFTKRALENDEQVLKILNQNNVLLQQIVEKTMKDNK